MQYYNTDQEVCIVKKGYTYLVNTRVTKINYGNKSTYVWWVATKTFTCKYLYIIIIDIQNLQQKSYCIYAYMYTYLYIYARFVCTY